MKKIYREEYVRRCFRSSHCCECRSPIDRHTPYCRVTWFWDNSPHSYRFCLSCNLLRVTMKQLLGRQTTPNNPRATMRVDVTQEDIDSGIRNQCTLCPVALALNRALEIETSVNGWDWRAVYSTHNLLPSAVQLWVLQFDTFKPVQPFSFEVDDDLVLHAKREFLRGQQRVEAYSPAANA